MTAIQHELYDIAKTYQENYDHGPFFDGEIPTRPEVTKKGKLFDFEINSPLGVPAGPLLNANWTELYAKLGFDIPVYKTVRSIERACHPLPNCAYLSKNEHFAPGEPMHDVVINGEPERVEDLTITNSFGVPSQPPSVWMADIEEANRRVGPGQVVIVSATGTPGIAERDLVEDYAYVSAMAREAGSKILEVNYSCPNVCSGEGSIYSDPETSSLISKKIREAIGDLPFIIKLGWLPKEELAEIIKANRPYVDGFAGINTVPMHVRNQAGEQALPGEGRLKSGICGNAITDVAEDFTKSMIQIREDMNDDFPIISVGGMMTESDLHARINMGADIVMTATAAMWDPYLAERFHRI